MPDTSAASATSAPAAAGLAEPPVDLAWGAFSDTPPWIVDPTELAWRSVVPGLRDAARAEVPTLTTPSRVPPGLRFLRVSSRMLAAVGPSVSYTHLTLPTNSRV